MQYGNEKVATKNTFRAGSLNRTMQYGNKQTVKIRKMNAELFKSYYVVWKLTKNVECSWCGASLNRTMQYGNYNASDVVGANAIGLNRTMQYGNLKYKTTTMENKKSLNRTMQYGNLHITSGQRCESVSLNRTMQYGNHKERQEEWVSFEV